MLSFVKCITLYSCICILLRQQSLVTHPPITNGNTPLWLVVVVLPVPVLVLVLVLLPCSRTTSTTRTTSKTCVTGDHTRGGWGGAGIWNVHTYLHTYLPTYTHVTYMHTYGPTYLHTNRHTRTCMHAWRCIIRHYSFRFSVVSFYKRKEVQEPKAVKGSSWEIIERTVRILRGKTWWRPGTYVGLFVVAERFWHVRTLVTLQSVSIFDVAKLSEWQVIIGLQGSSRELMQNVIELSRYFIDCEGSILSRI